ncbi:MAG: hypothetical protein ACI4DN_06800 [Lachnospiraceae bacterium]
MKEAAIGIIVVIIVVAVIIAGVVVYKNAGGVKLSRERTAEELQMEEYDGEAGLIATPETLEEAEKIAELYGITLISYENKVAVYLTDKDIRELIKMGKEKGYPTIDINYNYMVK